MTATTIYNSYSIALPSVQVAFASGQGFFSRAIEAVARRIAQSIIDQPSVQPAPSAAALAQWRTDAALRQHGMREWLATAPSVQPQYAATNPVDRAAAQAHKALWLELVA